jgi:uncharacterized protein (TIGR02466 family)
MNISDRVLQKEHIAMAFATPISTYLWPDSEALNAELKSAILARENAESGVARSNVGGWHSDTDLFLWNVDCVHELKTRVGVFARDLTSMMINLQRSAKINLRLEGWANVSRRGQYNSVHEHPGAVWSGVYYVASGKPDNADPLNGKLELIDPRSGINMLRLEGGPSDGRCLVEPKPGLMVMFPSWLKHMVHPFAGEGERISIAFNVTLQIQ